MRTYVEINYFKGCTNLDQIRKRYKELALINHPDKGGNTSTMQEINSEYQYIIKNEMFDFAQQTEEEKKEFIKYPEILSKIIGLEGIEIEIIGNWIWVSGNTYPHRVILKESGFFFGHKKVMWYYRPEDYKSTNRKPLDIEEIRIKYGSDKINNKVNKNELEAA